ncbi:MAG: DUF951 domain-containing protein [Ruminococcaceae bacterium]|nr:DUF951 domain-containing protein [Oscillospiraceae bacterium]
MIMLVGDKLEMKKKHPCGSEIFTVLRIGSDIKVRCDKCSREVTVSRIKLEKGIKRVFTPDTEERAK